MTENSSEFNDFEQALSESLAAKEMRVGDLMTGSIVAVHGDVALVDVGGKSEAVLERQELDDLGTGDPVEVVVVAVGEEIKVSRRLAVERKLQGELAEAAESGTPMEGKVAGRRKGGFDVTIGGVRGFCPVSHIEEGRTEDLDEHLGQTYLFKILEFDFDGRKLVVSRAKYLREERERLRAEAWSTLTAGTELEGTVRSITNFGAFVDLGGVDGLVHVTELSHRRIGHPRDVLTTGESVKVKILELDQQRDRISLSIKALQENPWDKASEEFPRGGSFSGKIVRKADFGAFVELTPGVEGLLHVSQLPPGMELNAPELEVGEQLDGWIREVDASSQRVGLTLRPLPDRDPWERIEMRYQEGSTVEGVVENGADFGVFIELEPGVSALVPASEISEKRTEDPRSAFRPGERISAKVMSVDTQRKRISLSVKAQKRDQERKEYQRHMDTGSEETSLTGFGAQLVAALGSPKKDPAAKAPEPEKKKPAAKKKAAATKKATAAKKKEPAEKKKAATTKKTAAKKPAAKKETAEKKSAAKKAATKKPAAKKEAAEKKPAAKKTAAAKKVPAKKETAEKKPAAKKATTKKAAPPKKTTTAKKPAARKTTAAKKKADSEEK
ncbi:MAG: S1 RNA-binding domain-containing protein [bacterium]|nr:S1 RNA-binding domain-containing protein [bacterium]